MPFLGIGMKTDFFQSCDHWWVFQICWHIECSTYSVSSFRIWNSLIGIPSPPLALFIVMLPKAHLISHSRMSASRWVITAMPEVRGSGWEELTHIRDQEQRLCFAGTAVKGKFQGKRNPSKTVGTERGDQRADRLKLQSQTTRQSYHTDHSLFISMQLSHAMWGHPRQLGHGREAWQNVVIGEGNGKPFQYSCLENPIWTVWKGKKIGHWKMNSPSW